MHTKFNALKTGAHALEPLLPWEDPAEYEKLRTEIFDDLLPKGKIQNLIADTIVANRWVRQRLSNTTAIEFYRHPFGEVLEEAGAKSWREAASIARAYNIDLQNTQKSIYKSQVRVEKIASKRLKRAENDEELSKSLDQIVDMRITDSERLLKIFDGLDAQQNFFLEYSPENLERRIRLENSLDAQYRKLRADLVIEQETEIMREKLRRSREGAGSPPDNSPGPHGDVDKDSVATVDEPSERTLDDACLGSDTEELRRNDADSDDWGEPIKRNDDNGIHPEKFANE